MAKLGRFGIVFIAILFWLPTLQSAAQQTVKPDGKLVVRVFWGDKNDPARDAFVYIQGYLGQASTVVKPIRPGWFEFSLAPGLYDVFVSELSSLPMCKRVEIKPGHTRVYTAKLETDDEHLED